MASPVRFTLRPTLKLHLQHQKVEGHPHESSKAERCEDGECSHADRTDPQEEAEGQRVQATES